MRAILRLAVSLVVLDAEPMIADEAKPSDLVKERQTLEAFAAAHKSCREWTDGCMVCMRKSDGGFDCSLPGIACLPSALTCRADASSAPAPTPPKPPEAPAPQTPSPTPPTTPEPKAPDPPKT